MRLHLSASERRSLMDVALGRTPADLVVRNARLVNVYSGEILVGQTVAVLGDRVAYVGSETDPFLGDVTRVVEADGRYLVPGLLDSHTHLLSRYSVEEFIRYAAPGGTTTVITELIELASVVGRQGITALLEALADQPLTFFGTLPPLVGLAPFVEEIAPPLDEYRKLLERDDVVGLGEVYWGNLLRGDERLLQLLAATDAAGKVAEGHSAGARGLRLAAYAAAGVSSCHEPITADEGLERLRLGLHWMAREGEIRRDLERFAVLWQERQVDLRRLILATDSVGPRRMVERGYLEENVRQAIQLGMEPIKAIQAASLTPAEHFNLDHLVGGIAPGKQADFFLTEDLRALAAQSVFARGVEIAREGELIVEPREVSFPRRMQTSVRRPRLVSRDDFVIPAQGRSEADVRLIEMVTHLVTQEGRVGLDPRDGELAAQPDQDIAKIAAFDRSGRTADQFVGFVRGFGMRAGALATTMAWDSACMVVIGTDDRDMALAADRLIDIQGGAAVFAGGAWLAEFAAPIGGVVSPAPMPDIVRDLERVEQALRELGCRLEDPLLAADVMTTAAIPHLRMTQRGYARLKDGALLGLFVE